MPDTAIVRVLLLESGFVTTHLQHSALMYVKIIDEGASLRGLHDVLIE
jgi:hypothetical protein